MWGFVITDAMRHAAYFEQAFWNMQRELTAIGKVPPSRDEILEQARRSPTMSAIQVVYYWRAHWKPPPPLL